MSQVRNLRAMFENKGESTSPPDRGRSPGIGSTGAESPRPLSKVRTSFIAIEKDGRIGLRRDQSGESSLSRRRMSIETEGESTAATQDPTTTSVDEPTKSFRANFAKEPPIPESPRQYDTAKRENKVETVPGKAANMTKPAPKTQSNNATPKPYSAGKAHTLNGSASGSKASQETGGTGTGTGNTKSANSRPAKLTTTAATAGKGPSKAAAKSPSTTKPLPSPTPHDGKPPRASGIPTAKKPATGTPKQTAAGSSKLTPSSGARKPPPMQISPSGVGFVKPKPKSPTKPAKLPASLTAPTRASVSKLNQGKSSAVTTAALQAPQSLARSSSRASVSTTASTLKHRTSGSSRQRPSLGPPPKKPVEETPASIKDKGVDEGFLARMMRPTQSSQSKTAEKAPVTPPRKGAARRPVTRDGEGSAKRDGSARKLLVASAKKTVPTAQPESPTLAVAATSEIAREVSQVETAEEAVTIVQEADITEGAEEIQKELETGEEIKLETSVDVDVDVDVDAVELDEQKHGEDEPVAGSSPAQDAETAVDEQQEAIEASDQEMAPEPTTELIPEPTTEPTLEPKPEDVQEPLVQDAADPVMNTSEESDDAEEKTIEDTENKSEVEDAQVERPAVPEPETESN